MLTASQILTEIDPYKVIDSKDTRGSFLALSKVWHPDVKGGDADVFTKISYFRDQIQKLESGCSEVDNLRVLTLENGDKYHIKFYYKCATPTSTMYFSKHCITYFEDASLKKVLNKFPSFDFTEKQMRDKLNCFLPLDYKTYKDNEGNTVYHFGKSKNLIPLKLFIDTIKPTVFMPTWAAWVVSRMLHVACYLKYIGLSYNGFSPHNVLINPVDHTISLYADWGLATPYGHKLKAVPSFVARNCSRHVLESKTSFPSIDLDCIKAVARFSFGDINGRNFHPDTPKSVKSWLISPALNTAFDEYKSWETALEGFGPRRFVKIDVDIDSLYIALI